MSKVITQFGELDLEGTYSYADYLLWNFEERLELIKGKIFRMSPAPSTRHQRISGNLFLTMGNFFSRDHCQIFYAPFDVRLKRTNTDHADQAIFTVVQPDICVICDQAKIDEKGCLGAPDLIVEILSPGNSRKEMANKFELYEESGVKEYWLVEPSESVVFVYVLNESGKYIGLQPAVDRLTSPTFPGLKIELEQIFR